MKKLIFASAIALAAAAVPVAPADAHVFFGLGSGYFGFGPFGDFYNSYSEYPFYGPYYGGPYYDTYIGPGYKRGYGSFAVPNRDRDCRIEVVRHRSHHHWVRRGIRVCGY
ncbi:hypothetical protein RFM26_10175 [Mesorhizobium sp. VK23B]|uniref:Sulfur globule protein n=1 Tax=Mesorhizobium dulcispinae TaxID=3072316 RepID=A0ABU4XAN7_9HYPH|nr:MULTISPECIES: hypothetical protein [unclassified Mesorhizobium]MDX8466046.1 hypothetical protein [Mesorhizobium sp. VK23B]MDX8471857.1 hypothetical protein [Mesorhizobium sp. VK23A]MDX8520719.1 hypothetical protein [Mesorhizobium sp. VK23D]